MRAEARRRVNNHTLQIVLPYGVCIGTVPSSNGTPQRALHAATMTPTPPAAFNHSRLSSAPFSASPAASSAASHTSISASAVSLAPMDTTLEPEPPLPGGGDCLSSSFTAWLSSALPPLGECAASLPGEEKYYEGPASHLKVPRPKPNARVRLFVVSGLADQALKLVGLSHNAPEWLEVRLLDLPGHGSRQVGQTIDGLPPCASQSTPETHAMPIEDQLQCLCDQLANEMLPLITGDRAIPYALLGFSFGAQIVYHLDQALRNNKVPPPLRNNSIPPPLLLVAVARCAPHCAFTPPSTIKDLQEWSDSECAIL